MHFVIYLLAKMQIKSNSPAILEAVVCVDGNFFSETNKQKTKQNRNHCSHPTTLIPSCSLVDLENML